MVGRTSARNACSSTIDVRNHLPSLSIGCSCPASQRYPICPISYGVNHVGFAGILCRRAIEVQVAAKSVASVCRSLSPCISARANFEISQYLIPRGKPNTGDETLCQKSRTFEKVEKKLLQRQNTVLRAYDDSK